MTEQLTNYLHHFTHLHRDRKNGGAPHKPILLLSVIRLFEKGIFTDDHIYILPELVATFKNYWSQLVITTHHSIFALPFYHMRSEPFWQLIPKAGCERWIESKSSMRSISNLTTAVKVALIDKNLTKLLLVAESRDLLKIAILDKYFEETRSYYHIEEDFFEASLLYETSEAYKKKILALKSVIDEQSFQEEIYIRSGLFQREIPKVYSNTCAISGLRVDALVNASMVDACHIVPFSEGYDDTLTNGIALCPNLHRAFDRGLISISDNYKVLINTNFVENTSPYNLRQFEGKEILLPTLPNLYPSLENFAQHRVRFDIT